MARKYNKLSREALKMLLDGVSRREVKQYLAGRRWMLNLHPCLTPWTPPTRNWLTDNEAYITGRTYCAS